MEDLTRAMMDGMMEGHSMPCGEALIRFPTTPAIQVCHGSSHQLRTFDCYVACSGKERG
jgi:hypothetical protein